MVVKLIRSLIGECVCVLSIIFILFIFVREVVPLCQPDGFSTFPDTSLIFLII